MMGYRNMSRCKKACCALVNSLFLLSAPAAAVSAQPVKVSLELVLAVDVSGSVDSHEYQLQMQGISQAFHDPKVTAAIERLGGNGIAVAIILWSQNYNIKLAVPFTHVSDRKTLWAFGNRAARVSRGRLAGYTALGGAIRHATQLLEDNRFDGSRRTIDISGDGRSNTRPALGVPRSAPANLGSRSMDWPLSQTMPN